MTGRLRELSLPKMSSRHRLSLFCFYWMKIFFRKTNTLPTVCASRQLRTPNPTRILRASSQSAKPAIGSSLVHHFINTMTYFYCSSD